ncbi:MAG: hypothetical protein PHD40_04905, partial [Syntrophomonadaceae bacterium]|nr:hypothetical protein [Syntrophomonadaceae bacterium]
MKIKLIFLSLFLCTALLIGGCGGGDAKDVPANSDKTQPTSSSSAEKSSSGFTKISDMADAWNEAYGWHEKAINDYEGMPLLELASAGLTFVSGVQYDLLNLENKNGHFEGELMLAGYPAFLDKKGNQLTFGYDIVLEEDGFGPKQKTGDRKVENGTFQLDKEYYVADCYTERAGQKIERTYSEFLRLKDGSMMCFDMSGYTIDAKGDESTSNKAVFIKISKDKLDVVIGKATTGTEFKTLSLAGKKDLTKEQAIEIFETAGYAIETTGGV